MKKSIMVLMAAALVTASVPAMASQHVMKHQLHNEQCQKECEMMARDCEQEADTIQQRIERLEQAINSNPGRYNKEQLSSLKYRLEEAQDTLAKIEQGGA